MSIQRQIAGGGPAFLLGEVFGLAIVKARACGDFVRAAVRRNQKLISKNAALRLQLSNKSDEANALRDELTSLRRRLSEKIIETGELQDTIASLEASVEQIEGTLDTLNFVGSVAQGAACEVDRQAVIFETLLGQELDIEDALRVGLEMTLEKTGGMNAVIFLVGDDHDLNMGAYVNYTVPRSSISDELGFVKSVLNEAYSYGDFSLAEDQMENVVFLDGCDYVLVEGVSRDNTMCYALFFRDKNRPFSIADQNLLSSNMAVLARHVEKVFNVHQRARSSWPDSPDGEFDDFGFGFV